MQINVILIIVIVILSGAAMLRIATLSVNSANLHFVQIVLNSAQARVRNNKGEQYDNSV